MRAMENVLSIVRNQPELEAEKAPGDMPNLSFEDATGLVEIETQANLLLDYISKLSSLADRACVSAIQQTETAQRSEETPENSKEASDSERRKGLKVRGRGETKYH